MRFQHLPRSPLSGNRRGRWLAVSDAVRLDSAQLVERLPPEVILILRDYEQTDRTGHLLRLLRRARARRLRCLVAGPPALARRLGAAGSHYPEYLTRRPPLSHALTRSRPFSAAAHSLPAILRADRLGATYILISPLYPTTSGERKKALGSLRLRRLCQGLPPRLRRKLVALGGILPRHLAACRNLPLGGIAGLSLYKGLTAVANPPQRM